MDRYLNAIKEVVCTHCIDSDSEGNCRIGGGKECTLSSKFDRIIETIQQTKSDRIDDYVGALRRNVCRECEYGSVAQCGERDAVECPLDRYFPLIVNTVEAIRLDPIA